MSTSSQALSGSPALYAATMCVRSSSWRQQRQERWCDIPWHSKHVRASSHTWQLHGVEKRAALQPRSWAALSRMGCGASKRAASAPTPLTGHSFSSSMDGSKNWASVRQRGGSARECVRERLPHPHTPSPLVLLEQVMKASLLQHLPAHIMPHPSSPVTAQASIMVRCRGGGFGTLSR